MLLTVLIQGALLVVVLLVVVQVGRWSQTGRRKP